MNKILQLFTLALVVLMPACGGSSNNSSKNSSSDPTISTAPTTRTFYMGFTTWPYDATVAATNYTYTLIQDHGDIVSHHLMSGIPWEESYAGTPLPNDIEEDISSRINQTDSGKEIYLSIDSLNQTRDDLASNWGDSGEEPRQDPWDARDFSDLEVANAYSNFALSMIDRFNPTYFNYAPEVSELILNDLDEFDRFVTFSERVYKNIKAAHPDLPLMVSVALKSPGSTDALTIEANFPRVSDFVDIVGISAYPYAFYEHSDKGNPSNMPSDWISQISSIAGSKPIAITETGWIAEDLTISNYGYSEQSDVNKQRDYVSEVLAGANDLSMEFVIWFTIVDYDALWKGVLEQDDLSKLWKDTGLYDENLNPRPALDVWSEYYKMEKNK